MQTGHLVMQLNISLETKFQESMKTNETFINQLEKQVSLIGEFLK